MIALDGARSLQHLPTELNPKLLGLFTMILLRMMADSPNLPARAWLTIHADPFLCAEFAELCRLLSAFLWETAFPKTY